MKKTHAGFSLIELLVVIVIMGILATISLGTFQGFFAKSRDSDRQAIFATLKTAIVADRTGSSEGYDITQDSDYSDVETYIATLMDDNELDLSYDDGCYYAGFGTDTANTKRNFFLAFLKEDTGEMEYFGTKDGIAAAAAVYDSNVVNVFEDGGNCAAASVSDYTVEQLFDS